VTGSAAARPRGKAAAAPLALAVAGVLLELPGGPAAQQQGGGIETQPLGPIDTQPLEPLTPPEGEGDPETGSEGVVPRDERFKVAPYRGVTSPVAPQLIQPIETQTAPGVVLRELDKMTGRTTTVEIATGAETMVNRLKIHIETCQAPPDNSQHGTKAYLQIWDTKHPQDGPVFSGWMFAESPALSSMDHPRYDVWVISCTTSSGEAAKANP